MSNVPIELLPQLRLLVETYNYKLQEIQHYFNLGHYTKPQLHKLSRQIIKEFEAKKEKLLTTGTL